MSKRTGICRVHNLPYICCNPGQYFCKICIIGNDEIMSIEEADQKQNEKINIYLTKVDIQMQALNKLKNEINQYKANILYFTEKFVNHIINYIENFNESKSKIKNLLSQEITLKDLEKKCDEFLEQNYSKAKQFFEKIQSEFNKQCAIPELNECLAEIYQESNCALKKSETDLKVEENSIIIASRNTTQAQFETDQNMEESNQKQIMKSAMELGRYQSEQFTTAEITRSFFVTRKEKQQDDSKITLQSYNDISEIFDVQQEIEQQNTKLFLDKFFKYQKFTYENLSDSTLQSSDQNLVFLLNNDSTLLFVAQYDTILVYQFDQGVIKQKLQTLKGHQDTVNCLYLMNKQNLLVSGSTDKIIIIWSCDKKKIWKASIYLYGHQQLVLCIIGNQSENLLISGGGDKSIKFWKQLESRWRFWKEQKWVCQQTINIDFMVYSLSLNISQSKLIANGSSDVILVFEQVYGKSWQNSQKIQVDEQGYRSCFTYDDQFVFQSKFKRFLDIFSFNHKQDFFEKTQQVKLSGYQDSVGYMPRQFIVSKGILMVKHGKFINLLTPFQNREFILEQQIEFTGYYIYGTMSSDAEYLIAQDMGSKLISIRKIRYLE